MSRQEVRLQELEEDSKIKEGKVGMEVRRKNGRRR